MDVDISDILADVSRPLHVTSQSLQDSDPDTAYTDHQLLVRAWTSERCSPDLLPYPTELVARVIERVRSQIARIEDMTSGMTDHSAGLTRDGGVAAGAGGPYGRSNQNTNLVLSILQTDLSRTQFIVRSLLRQRLAKITKHATFYFSQLNVSNTTTKTDLLLSEAEMQFLRTHQALLSDFYDGSFLSAFPSALRRLDDSSGGVNMVEGPEQEGAVVARCLSERWSNEDQLKRDEGVGVELEMRRGEVWVVRWGDVKAGVLHGDLELL